jgi:hypothetical protein
MPGKTKRVWRNLSSAPARTVLIPWHVDWAYRSGLDGG